MKTDYVIRSGETLFMSLDVKEGDPSIVTSVVARLKPAGPNGSIPSRSVPAVADFLVTFRPATVDRPVGWNLLIEDEVTFNFKPGIYVADARFSYVDGSSQQTEPVLIEIKGGVS